MGKLLGGGISPHPPIILPIVGRGREEEASKTVEGMKKLAKKVASLKPDTLIVITPHGNVFRDAHSIIVEEDLTGDLNQFGIYDYQMKLKNDVDLAQKIIEKAKEKSVPLFVLDQENSRDMGQDISLDWGVIVPLDYILKEVQNIEVVPMAYGYMNGEEMRRMGEVLKEAIEESGKNVIIIASGDLSHKLKDEGPYDFHPQGPVFDKKIVDLLEDGDFQAVLDFDQSISDPAGECGLRSFQILSGALKNYTIESEIYSYEGPFGVGYMTGFFENKED